MLQSGDAGSELLHARGALAVSPAYLPGHVRVVSCLLRLGGLQDAINAARSALKVASRLGESRGLSSVERDMMATVELLTDSKIAIKEADVWLSSAMGGRNAGEWVSGSLSPEIGNAVQCELVDVEAELVRSGGLRSARASERCWRT